MVLKKSFFQPATTAGNKPLSLYRIKQRGSTMWEFIIGLIYRRCCRNYLAAARKQRELWA